jgi:hypothetical protein
MPNNLYIAVAVAVVGLSAPLDVARAQHAATIDFQGLPEGTIVDAVSRGAGIGGDVVAGAIAVLGETPDPAITTNAAILFDATCTGGCTGGDTDLEKPQLGNVLIMALHLTDAGLEEGFRRFRVARGIRVGVCG